MLIAIIIGALIIEFIFQTVTVDGTSMYNTLHHNDRLVIDEISYRFTFPKRGDIVAFKCPSNTNERFIKRVIAIQGDKIKIVDDKVYVNGKQLHEKYTYYMNKEVTDDPRVHNLEEKVVPEGSVFVLGDNRYNSLDSRFENEVGFVNKKLIIGKEFLRIYPFNTMGRIH